MKPTPITIMGAQTFKFTKNHTGLTMQTALARNFTVSLTMAHSKLRKIHQMMGIVEYTGVGAVSRVSFRMVSDQ